MSLTTSLTIMQTRSKCLRTLEEEGLCIFKRRNACRARIIKPSLPQVKAMFVVDEAFEG